MVSAPSHGASKVFSCLAVAGTINQISGLWCPWQGCEKITKRLHSCAFRNFISLQRMPILGQLHQKAVSAIDIREVLYRSFPTCECSDIILAGENLGDRSGITVASRRFRSLFARREADLRSRINPLSLANIQHEFGAPSSLCAEAHDLFSHSLLSLVAIERVRDRDKR